MKDNWQMVPETVGTNAKLRMAVIQAMRAVEEGRHFLVEGEAGSGRRLLARRAWAQHAPGVCTLFTLDCRVFCASDTELLLFGERQIHDGHTTIQLGRLNLAAGGGLLLLHVESLPARTQLRLAAALTETARRTRAESFQLMLTADNTTVKANWLEPELAAMLLPIHVPPLRERVEDIPALCEAFLRTMAPFDAVVCSPALLARFSNYAWPGNVAELRSVLRQLMLEPHGRQLDVKHLKHLNRDRGSAAMLRVQRNTASAIKPGFLFQQTQGEEQTLR